MIKMKISPQRAVLLFLLAFAAIIFSCGNEQGKQSEAEQQGRFESMNSGTITVYCEEGIAGIMKVPFSMYEKDYPKVKFSSQIVSAREAMKYLLGGYARIIIASRGYLRDEDSLMKVYKVPVHPKMIVASDALVLFTAKGYPVDMIMKAGQLKDYFTKKENLFSSLEIYPQIKIKDEPVFAINNFQSSEYSNFLSMIAGGAPLMKNVRILGSVDSVKKFVLTNKNAIGIGYLSQLAKDTNFHFISIGFNDSTGKYINPKPVHQGYVVQKLYPYIVPVCVYILEDRRNLPYWFAMYLSKEGKIQKYFLDIGIVPEYALIKGIPEQ